VRLPGKVAVITGAARGIGAGVAERFAREGAFVHLFDRDAEGLGATVASIAGQGFGVAGHACDVSDAGSVERAVAEVIARHPRPDVLVANAGVNPTPASIVATSPEQWSAVFATNAAGVFHTVRALVPRLADGGSVVLVASVVALRGVRDAAAYVASKGAVVALARAMALDHAPRVRVNAVCPGAIATDMFEAYVARAADPEAERRRVLDGIPLGRLGTPADVAAAALFLASDEAAWVTGHALVVDGGDSV